MGRFGFGKSCAVNSDKESAGRGTYAVSRRSTIERAELWRTWNDALTWAVAVVLIITPLTISVRGTVGAGLVKTVVAQSMILLIVAAWLVRTAVCGIRPRLLPSIGLPIAVFVGINAISLFGTSDLSAGLLKLSQLVLFSAMSIVCMDAFEKRDDMVKVFSATVFAGFLASVYGIAQHYGKDVIQWEGAQIDIHQAPSTFGNPNFAAEFLVAALPLSVTLLLVLPGFWRRASLAICTGTMFVHLWFTTARAGLVGVIVTAVVMATALLWHMVRRVFVRDGARRLVVAVGLLIVLSGVVAGMAGRGAFSRIAGLSDKSIASRIVTWHSALDMVRDNPWRGIGLGDFDSTMPLYWSPFHQRLFIKESTVVRSVHNDFLEIAAETGIPGLAAFLLILSVSGVLLWRRVGREADFRSRVMFAGMGASLVGILTQILFTFSLKNASSALLFWTLLGLVGGAMKSGDTEVLDTANDVAVRIRRGWIAPLYALAAVCVCVAPLRFCALGADYRLRIAQALLERGKYEEAKTELNRALSLDPLNFDALFKRSVAESALGAHDSAQEGYRRCLELRPNDIFSLVNLGSELVSANRLEEASVFLKEAVSLVPRYAIARKALASCYTKQGNLRDAIEELEAAQKCAPDDVSICVSLAECYRAAGMADSAIHQYEKALLIEPQGAAVRLDLGFLYLAVRDYERAADSLEKVIALNDGAASARAPLAHAYLERGKLLDAALQCRDYVMLRGANADIARALASDIESRLRDLHDETGTGVADRTRFVLAQVFAALNEADRAVAHLEQIDGTKHGILFRQMVAQALAQQGKVREQPVQGTLDGR